MQTKLLITVIGQDQPGLVERISDTVRQQQGNWLESRLSHLGDKFAGLVLAEFAAEDLLAAEKALSELSSASLEIKTEITGACASSELISLQLVGNDKPGIVYEISQKLNQLQVNVESMTSEVESAPVSGGMLFKASLKLSLPQGVTFDEVQTQLETIADDMMVDLAIE